MVPFVVGVVLILLGSGFDAGAEVVEAGVSTTGLFSLLPGTSRLYLAVVRLSDPVVGLATTGNLVSSGLPVDFSRR